MTVFFAAAYWKSEWKRSTFGFVSKSLASFASSIIINLNYFFVAQADTEFASSLASRGFSASEVPEKDKPSSVISSLQTYFKNGVDA